MYEPNERHSPYKYWFTQPLLIHRRKSQIQTFLEQNEGPGLQHLALKTDDIFRTIEMMRSAEDEFGGFELMKRPSDRYYSELPERLGDQLSVSQWFCILCRFLVDACLNILSPAESVSTS
jgi:hypothetical protein